MPVMALPDSVQWYDLHAANATEQHEVLQTDALLAWAADLLPEGRPAVLDVGAGSGRDSAWFAGCGADVVTVEPSAAMREEGQKRHSDQRLRWVDDALPSLLHTSRLGISFDLILLSAVWQHVSPGDRRRALRKLVALLKPGGLLLVTLRLGEPEAGRGMHPVGVEELTRLAREHGLAVVRSHEMADLLNRSDVRWVGMAFPMTARALCHCCAMSSSTTRRARPTSWPCCAACAALRMEQPGWRVRQTTSTWHCRWAWWR